MIRATFLGAHAFPELYKNNQNDYVELIMNEMIPAIASEELADFIDEMANPYVDWSTVPALDASANLKPSNPEVDITNVDSRIQSKYAKLPDVPFKSRCSISNKYSQEISCSITKKRWS